MFAHIFSENGNNKKKRRKKQQTTITATKSIAFRAVYSDISKNLIWKQGTSNETLMPNVGKYFGFKNNKIKSHTKWKENKYIITDNV